MRYVVVNDHLVNWNTGFRVIVNAAGETASKYYEVYYRRQNDKLTPALLYYPEYYRSMAVRLYCFDGKDYTPAETAVISWEAKTGSDSQPYKEITGLKTFPSHGEATAFLAAQQGGNWRMVGKDPLASPYWGDFTGFPPLMFQVSGAELMLDNSVLAAAKAKREGVTTQLSIWPGMPHDFTLFAFLPEAQRGIGELVQFVERHPVLVDRTQSSAIISGQEAPR